ncbi:MAG: encapsulin, partial [Acidimicrobiales bacterium]
MNHLLRDVAPVPESAWSQIEAEAERTLKHFLTARRLVDFSGPEGWAKDAVTRGHVKDVG